MGLVQQAECPYKKGHWRTPPTLCPLSKDAQKRGLMSTQQGGSQPAASQEVDPDEKPH